MQAGGPGYQYYPGPLCYAHRIALAPEPS